MKSIIQKSLLMTLLSLFAGSVFAAGSVTSNFQSSASLQMACSISTYNISFGDTHGSGVNSGHGVNVVCSKGLSFNVVFGPGSSGDMLHRSMVGAVHGDQLKYNILKDIAANQTMGDGTNGTYLFTGVGTGGIVGSTEIVQLIGGQFPTPDDYSDTITVSVNY